ncbi:hypothetical protein BDY21DRAFT_54531 [Lineolata rhizophorae]|uniref:Uncharacterized protein n=1 Tax=Lineolata rhizophorae TaxID=578093 RepID=A0A6A6NZD7_9PEZI|nr:hypothetical protein BDY21DRAFT_54531 [Lineolata rhizophorae]
MSQRPLLENQNRQSALGESGVGCRRGKRSWILGHASYRTAMPMPKLGEGGRHARHRGSVREVLPVSLVASQSPLIERRSKRGFGNMEPRQPAYGEAGMKMRERARAVWRWAKCRNNTFGCITSHGLGPNGRDDGPARVSARWALGPVDGALGRLVARTVGSKIRLCDHGAGRSRASNPPAGWLAVRGCATVLAR